MEESKWLNYLGKTDILDRSIKSSRTLLIRFLQNHYQTPLNVPNRIFDVYKKKYGNIETVLSTYFDEVARIAIHISISYRNMDGNARLAEIILN